MKFVALISAILFTVASISLFGLSAMAVDDGEVTFLEDVITYGSLIMPAIIWIMYYKAKDSKYKTLYIPVIISPLLIGLLVFLSQ